MIASLREGFIEGFRNGPKLFFEPVVVILRIFKMILKRPQNNGAGVQPDEVIAKRLASKTAQPKQQVVHHIQDPKFVELVKRITAETSQIDADVRQWKLLRYEAETIEASEELSEERKNGLLIELILFQVYPLLDKPSFKREDFRINVKDDVDAIRNVFKRSHVVETKSLEVTAGAVLKRMEVG